jgi:hypothetical protein
MSCIDFLRSNTLSSNLSMRVRAFGLLALASFCLSLSSHAEETRTAPLIEPGYIFFAGTAEKSLTGAKGYSMQFRSEGERGTYRPSVAADFFFSSGSTSVSSTASSFKLYGGSFVPGYSIFIFREGYFQPFFGLAGIIGWNYFNLSTPPAGVEGYTQGFSYGYEVSSGVDIRFKRSDTSAMRLKASMSTVRARIAGQTAFGLGGFRFTVGFYY